MEVDQALSIDQDSLATRQLKYLLPKGFSNRIQKGFFAWNDPTSLSPFVKLTPSQTFGTE